LAAIKGVGDKALQSIIAGRGGRDGKPVAPYKSLFDFCERVDLRVVNKGVIESLIKCGAYDSIHSVRAAAIAAVETAVRMAQQSQEAKRAGQELLFGASAAGANVGTLATLEPKLPAIPEWPKGEKMALEKSVLGFYVTNHPLRDIETLFQSYITYDTQSVRAASDKAAGLMGGLVSKIRMMTTKSGPNAGSRWAILLIEDLVGSMEVVLYSNEYKLAQELIKPDAVLFFEGTVDKTREEPSFKAREVYTLEAVQKKKTREIVVQTSSVKLDDATVEAMKKIFADNKGGTPVKLELSDLSVQPAVRVQLQVGGGINIQAGAVQALKTLFGESQVYPLGPNRRMKRAAPPAAELPLIAPSDELVEVG